MGLTQTRDEKIRERLDSVQATLDSLLALARTPRHVRMVQHAIEALDELNALTLSSRGELASPDRNRGTEAA